MGRLVIHMPTLSARGGAERYAVELAAVLSSEGHKVAIAAVELEDLGDIARYFGLDLDGVELLRLPELTWTETLRPRRLALQARDQIWARALRRWKPGVLVNAVYKSELVLRGVPHVAVVHFPHRRGVDGPGVGSRVLSRIRGLGGVYPPQGSLVVANSDFTRRHVVSRWGARATVLYPPCPMVAAPQARKERWIVSVGRFSAPRAHVPNKRMDVLVKAFARMTNLHQEGYRLKLIGSASASDMAYMHMLQKASVGLPIDIEVDVPFSRLEECYSRAEIYWHAQGYGEDENLHPEAMEHFGMTTVEAMSGGMIPVVLGVAGPQEVVGAVDPTLTWRTIDELTTTTRRVIGLPPVEKDDLRRRLRCRAEAFSREAFRVEALRIFDPLLSAS